MPNTNNPGVQMGTKGVLSRLYFLASLTSNTVMVCFVSSITLYLLCRPLMGAEPEAQST